jgi:hypothetical protein
MRRFRLFDCSLLFVLTIVPTANAQRFTVTTFGDVGAGTTSQSITVTGTNTSGQPMFSGALPASGTLTSMLARVT